MAINSCPECGKQVSSHALFCPSCGYPVRRRRGGFLGGCLAALIILLLAAAGIMWWLDIELPFLPDLRPDSKPVSPIIQDATSTAPVSSSTDTVSIPAEPGVTQFNMSGSIQVNQGQLTIQNRDPHEWKDVRVILNGSDEDSGFVGTLASIPAGQTVSMDLSTFKHENGTFFDPTQMKVQSVFLSCTTPAGSGIYSRKFE